MAMHKESVFWCTLGAFILLLASSSAETITTQLDIFDSISICAPLNVLVVPTPINKVTIDADESVLPLVKATVSGSQLSIETTGDIHVEGSIEVRVYLPATALRALEVRSTAGVYLAPGFTSEVLSLSTGQLEGSIAATQLTAKQLSIFAEGLAKVTVDGSFEKVSVDAQGASSVHIAGLQNEATLSLTGLLDVAISATSAGASIVGTSQGSRVLFNQGTCLMKGSAAGGALCVKDSGLTISAAPLQWVCKAAITGSNTCQISGSYASAFSSAGSGCPVMAWKDADASPERPATTRRRLRQTSTSVSSSSSSSGSDPISYSYTKTSTGADGQPAITSCSFTNNKGGCQVNGVPVPVQQYSGDLPILPPAPAPAPEGAPAATQAVASTTQTAQTAQAAQTASSVSSAISSATSTGGSGTSCVFVNGIGGCQSTG
jgi:hypothetical protein